MDYFTADNITTSIFYWIPIWIGLILVFLYNMPFHMEKIMNARSPFWLILCISAGGILSIPFIQYIGLGVIIYITYLTTFNKMERF